MSSSGFIKYLNGSKAGLAARISLSRLNASSSSVSIYCQNGPKASLEAISPTGNHRRSKSNVHGNTVAELCCKTQTLNSSASSAALAFFSGPSHVTGENPAETSFVFPLRKSLLGPRKQSADPCPAKPRQQLSSSSKISPRQIQKRDYNKRKARAAYLPAGLLGCRKEKRAVRVVPARSSEQPPTAHSAISSCLCSGSSTAAGPLKGKAERARLMRETLQRLRSNQASTSEKLFREALRSFFAEIVGQETGPFAAVMQCVKAEFDRFCDGSAASDRDNESLKKTLAEEKVRCGRLDSQIRELELRHADAEIQLKRLGKENAELKMRLFEAKTRLVGGTENKGELEGMRRENGRLRKYIEKLQADIEKRRMRETTLVGIVQSSNMLPPGNEALVAAAEKHKKKQNDRSVEVGRKKVKIPVLDFSRVRPSLSSDEDDCGCDCDCNDPAVYYNSDGAKDKL